MVPPTNGIHVTPLQHHSHNSALRQFLCTSTLYGSDCRVWKQSVLDLLPPYKSIMQMLAELQVMSCFCVCSSCTLPPMHRSENNHSKRFGILTISPSSLSWRCILMPLDASFEIQQSPTVLSRVRCSGHTALDTKDGESPSSAEDYTSSKEYGASSTVDETPKSPKSLCTLKVRPSLHI
jgi:hypothetical protein